MTENRKRKLIMLFAIVIITAVFVSARIIANSPYHLERRIQCVKEDINDLVRNDETTWRTIAESALKEANGLDYRLYRDAYRSNFSQDLDTQICELISCSSVKFDQVYTVSQKLPTPGYPENSCVFRYTIPYKLGVYAWVDLVYVPSSTLQDPQWYQQYSRTPENIGDGWYIIVFYGY